MRTETKTNLHPRNIHRDRYDFTALIHSTPELKKYVHKNPYGDDSVDFSNPDAVKTLNKALLQTYYKINSWDIPSGFLCPPIPGRADYIHYIADLFEKKEKVTGLDIGVGANCIYPLLGNSIYDWHFVGSDISEESLKSAQKIISDNHLEEKITLRLQSSKKHIFHSIIKSDDRFDFTMCNPPFHSSLSEASSGSERKWKNLGKGKTSSKPVLNFGGQGNELWTQGGEIKFLELMIKESADFKDQCQWFTTLVSKKENLNSVYYHLNNIKAVDVKTIEMGQGQKKSRMVAWTFKGKK